MAQTFVDFRHVKANATFEPVLAHYGVEGEGKGRQKEILCPFHDERKPSCKIDLDKGIFHCFGCGAKGNALDFVAKREGVDLRTAALMLSDWCGIEPAPPRERGQGSDQGRSAKASKSAAEPSSGGKSSPARPEPQTGPGEAPAAPGEARSGQRLRPLSFSLHLDPAHPYLRQRGLSEDEIETFGLGLAERGVMAGRIAIPIHDELGQLVAYAGRWPGEPPEGEPKYRFPQGFEKSRVLFNLHRLPADVREAVVVEGFFGAIAAHAVGLPVVACMGSSMSSEQLALLANFGITHLKVLMDGDAAGLEAGRKLAAEATERFYVRRVVLPKGRQPDEAIAEAVQSGHRPDWLEVLYHSPTP